MSAHDNSGPAFPTLGNIGYQTDWQSDDGMSLRDWFAGQALAGFMANSSDTGSNGWLGILDVAARNSYAAADAMIAARKGDTA